MLIQTGQQIEDWLDAAEFLELGGVNFIVESINTADYTIASSSDAYRNIELFSELYPNQVYTFQVESSSVISGTATQFDVAIWERSTNIVHSIYTLPISSSKQILTFTTPNVRDLSFLLYPSVRGSSNNVSTRFIKFMLEIGNKNTKYVPNFNIAFSNLNLLITEYNKIILKLEILEAAARYPIKDGNNIAYLSEYRFEHVDSSNNFRYVTFPHGQFVLEEIYNPLHILQREWYRFRTTQISGSIYYFSVDGSTQLSSVGTLNWQLRTASSFATGIVLQAFTWGNNQYRYLNGTLFSSSSSTPYLAIYPTTGVSIPEGSFENIKLRRQILPFYTHFLSPDTEYTFSVGNSRNFTGTVADGTWSTASSYTVAMLDTSNNNATLMSWQINVSNSLQYITFRTPSNISSNSVVLGIYCGTQGNTARRQIAFNEIELFKGTIKIQ